MIGENAKYSEPDETVVALFTKVLSETGLDLVIKSKILGIENFKSTEVVQVKKATDLIKVLAKDEAVDVVFLVNEWELDVLEDEKLKKMIVEEAINSISFDYEKGTINIIKPDFSSFFGIVKKYSSETLLNAKELIKLQVEAKIQEEKDAKEAKKQERKSKAASKKK